MTNETSPHDKRTLIGLPARKKSLKDWEFIILELLGLQRSS